MADSLAKYPKQGDVVSLYLNKHGVKTTAPRPMAWISRGGMAAYNKMQINPNYPHLRSVYVVCNAIVFAVATYSTYDVGKQYIERAFKKK